MKKQICAFALALIMLLGVCSCGTTSTPETTEKTTEPETSTASGATEAGTTEDQTVVITDPPVKEVPEKIKILAIGNSFSTDCMEYLWRMLKNAGVKTVILGNLYYGGCTLAQHLSFAKNDSASYTYFKNTRGNWDSTANYKMSAALADEEWDIITFQESSKTCGVESAFDASYAQLVNYVKGKNPNATFVWNMTWAYQQDSTHSAFPTYSNNQMTMYNMLINCAKKYPAADKSISYIIPVGTAVQNARTSFLGDHLTRDGYHLNKTFGRYLAALTWTCKITGVEPIVINYNPSTLTITDDMIGVAYEAVKNALEKPYEVTESKYKTGNGSLVVSSSDTTSADPAEILNPEDFYEADKAIAAANSVNLDNYTLFKWDYLENTYWNCTSKAGTTVPGSSAGTYKQNVCSKEKFALTTVPVGTVFICDTGWQYRIELYNNTTDKFTGSRPAMCSNEFFALTSDFMQGASYLSWNIAANPKADISAIYAQAAVHVRVYVPKTAN